jgi:hypothetical protein
MRNRISAATANAFANLVVKVRLYPILILPHQFVAFVSSLTQ